MTNINIDNDECIAVILIGGKRKLHKISKDGFLDWSNHLANTTNKVSEGIGMLYHYKRYLNNGNPIEAVQMMY